MVLEWIIASTIAVSLLSLVGAVVFYWREKLQEKILFASVSVATGTLLAAAFLDLLPEALEKSPAAELLPYTLLGIIVFFAIENLLSWHHHHATRKHKGEKPVGYLNFVGDGLHNFFDGAAIAAAYSISVPAGAAATLAIALHEVPQEIGDFGLLIYSGFSKTKAIAFNLLTALTAIAGALAFYYGSQLVEKLEVIGLAFTAGVFIYIAAVDLLPEFHREKTQLGRAALRLPLILAGIAAVWLVVKAA